MRILAVDLGDVRVGLAVSDPGGRVATPLETVDVGDAADVGTLAGRIADAARRHGAEAVVVGLPRALSGREGRPAQHARAVAARLEEELGLAVELWDERFTTVEAERAMLQSGARRRERRAAVDRVAATLLLQSYLDARRGGRTAGEGGDARWR